MLRMITNRSPSPKLKPLPRAAQTNRSPSPAPLRGFPLPLWRGVNGIANHSRTGSPCPVLQQEARVFTPLSDGEGLGVGLLVSVPCSPTRSEGIHSPLQRGGVGGGALSPTGTGVGLLYIYAILRAFSETHQITV